MLKVLNAKQIKELDQYTIKREPISSIDLMERACQAFVEWFTAKFNTSATTGIVCGTGNNGGDGLGIARILNDQGYTIKVWVVRGQVPETVDFKKNFSRLGKKIYMAEIIAESDKNLFGECDILIDGIFGSGLSRPLDGIYEQVVRCMNESAAKKIAIDVPSGLMSDQHSQGAVVKADNTVSFHLPKLAFFLPDNGRYVGDWSIVDIGLNAQFIEQAFSNFFLITKEDVKNVVKRRSKFDHKGDFGHGLLIAGSNGKMGACLLAARAALRTGPGLITVRIPKIGYPIVQSMVPEAMAITDIDKNIWSEIHDVHQYSAVGVGPGIGQNVATKQALLKLLDSFRNPLVIDADALNILSANKEFISKVPHGSILTPHPKEFERLVGPWTNDFEKLEKLQKFSSEYKLIIVLKGAHTAIAMPEGKVYFNSTGNPGMAKGGSGDVLTGILTGLLTQGYESEMAALMGVYLHGLAGDIALEEKSVESIIASDLIEALPGAFRRLGL